MPNKSIPKIPYKLLNGKRPALKNFHIWGCKAKIKPSNPSTNNLIPKSSLVLLWDTTIILEVADSIILLILLELLNQIKQSFLRMSWIVVVKYHIS